VHRTFKYAPATLYRAVDALDRYLGAVEAQVNPRHVPLVAAGALLLAAKFEGDDYDLELLSQSAGQEYTRKDLIDVELSMADTLGYELGRLTIYDFLADIATCDGAHPATVVLAQYVAECTLMWYDMLMFSPSMVAASVMFVALETTSHGRWTPEFTKHTAYSSAHLYNSLEALEAAASGAPPSFRAVANKYGFQPTDCATFVQRAIEGLAEEKRDLRRDAANCL
jgi:hypothetical protein